jgi:hypothetical protein
MPIDARALLKGQGWTEGKGLTERGRALPVTAVVKANVKGVGHNVIEIGDPWDDVYNKVAKRMSIKTSDDGAASVRVAASTTTAAKKTYGMFVADPDSSEEEPESSVASVVSHSSSSASSGGLVERKMQATMYAQRSSGKLKRLYSQEAAGLAALKNKRQKTSEAPAVVVEKTPLSDFEVCCVCVCVCVCVWSAYCSVCVVWV